MTEDSSSLNVKKEYEFAYLMKLLETLPIKISRKSYALTILLLFYHLLNKSYLQIHRHVPLISTIPPPVASVTWEIFSTCILSLKLYTDWRNTHLHTHTHDEFSLCPHTTFKFQKTWF